MRAYKPKNNYQRPKYRFDFDVGYLVKSPCQKCQERPTFPKCMSGCDKLDRIQSVLSETISCSRYR